MLTHTPIDMVLFCPRCGFQHVDATPDAHKSCAGTWTNPPHRSHLCHDCGFIWRPADVPTNGVLEVKSKGLRDGVPYVWRAGWRSAVEGAALFDGGYA